MGRSSSRSQAGARNGRGLGCADTAAGMALAKRRMADGALIEEGCIIDQDDSDHDRMDDLRIGRETLLSLL